MSAEMWVDCSVALRADKVVAMMELLLVVMSVERRVARSDKNSVELMAMTQDSKKVGWRETMSAADLVETSVERLAVPLVLVKEGGLVGYLVGLSGRV